MKKKDNQRFERIYYAYKDDVLRICYLYLKDNGLAEDAAQETFCRVLGKLHTLKDDTRLKSWILSITVNICKNKLRHKSRREIPTETLPDGGAAAADLDTALSVTEAIGRLTPELREIIILYYYQELTQREIAAILKVPETTVAYRLRTAKKQLKDFLKEDSYE